MCKLPIDKACGLWYNRGGAGRADHGREGPNSRSDTPYANFQILLAGFPKTQIFPKLKATLINAPGAVEFAGWLVYQDNPELEQEIIKMWNDEYRIKFEEIIWG